LSWSRPFQFHTPSRSDKSGNFFFFWKKVDSDNQGRKWPCTNDVNVLNILRHTSFADRLPSASSQTQSKRSKVRRDHRLIIGARRRRAAGSG
jgi:hypothetical protein